jgi:hypothetical protein
MSKPRRPRNWAKIADQLMSNDLHVHPLRGEHTASPDCWCYPRIIYTDPANGVRVWTHGAPS